MSCFHCAIGLSLSFACNLWIAHTYVFFPCVHEIIIDQIHRNTHHTMWWLIDRFITSLPIRAVFSSREPFAFDLGTFLSWFYTWRLYSCSLGMQYYSIWFVILLALLRGKECGWQTQLLRCSNRAVAEGTRSTRSMVDTNLVKTIAVIAMRVSDHIVCPRPEDAKRRVIAIAVHCDGRVCPGVTTLLPHVSVEGIAERSNTTWALHLDSLGHHEGEAAHRPIQAILCGSGYTWSKTGGYCWPWFSCPGSQRKHS